MSKKKAILKLIEKTEKEIKKYQSLFLKEKDEMKRVSYSFHILQLFIQLKMIKSSPEKPFTPGGVVVGRKESDMKKEELLEILNKIESEKEVCFISLNEISDEIVSYFCDDENGGVIITIKNSDKEGE